METKYYENIIMLGENCEPAFQFKRYFGFVEPFPYCWCRMCDLEKFLCAFADESLLWSEEVQHILRNNMFMDKANLICFHGKRRPKDFTGYQGEELKAEVDKELSDLKGRTAHLLDKLHKVWLEGKTQLYVSALQIEDTRRIENWIDTVRNILSKNTRNFEMLIVLKDGVNIQSSGG